MARISYLEKQQAPPDVQEIYGASEKDFGKILNIFKAIGHNPDFLKTVASVFDSLGKTKVDRKLRELAYLTTSVTNRCEY